MNFVLLSGSSVHQQLSLADGAAENGAGDDFDDEVGSCIVVDFGFKTGMPLVASIFEYPLLIRVEGQKFAVHDVNLPGKLEVL